MPIGNVGGGRGFGLRAKVEMAASKSSLGRLEKDLEQTIENVEDRGIGIASRTRPGSFADRTGANGVGMGGAAGAAGGAGLLSRLGGGAKLLGTVALGGTVAVSMLSALQHSSGRLQATNSMLGQMFKLGIKPLGDFIGRLWMPWAKAGLKAMVGFNKIISNEGLAIGGMESLLRLFQNLPGEIGKAAIRSFGQGLEGLFGDSAFFDALQNFEWKNHIPIIKWVDWLDPLEWAKFANPLSWPRFIAKLAWENWLSKVDWASWIPDINWSNWIPEFGGWPTVKADWPGWPSINTEWPGWPSINSEWIGMGGWPALDTLWDAMGGWPDLGELWPGWPDISFPADFWPTVTLQDVLDALTGGKQKEKDPPKETTGGNGGNTDPGIPEDPDKPPGEQPGGMPPGSGPGGSTGPAPPGGGGGTGLPPGGVPDPAPGGPSLPGPGGGPPGVVPMSSNPLVQEIQNVRRAIERNADTTIMMNGRRLGESTRRQRELFTSDVVSR